MVDAYLFTVASWARGEARHAPCPGCREYAALGRAPEGAGPSWRGLAE